MQKLSKEQLPKFLKGVTITGVKVVGENEDSNEIVLKLEKNGMVKELKVFGGGSCGDDLLLFELVDSSNSFFNERVKK